MTKKRIFLFTFLALLLSLPSCPKKQPNEIKIGVVLPLTGASANHGQDARDGLELAMEDIQKNPPIKGKEIQLIYEDNHSSATDSVSATQKLINSDGVRIIIGPIASSDALAMIPVTEASNVLLFSPAASSPKITGKGKIFFRISLLAEPQGQMAARFTLNTLKFDRVSIFFLNDDTGRGYAGSFADEFQKLGGTIAFQDSYGKELTDFKSQILKLKEAGSKVVYLPAVPRTLGLIIKQSHELGYDPIFVSNYGSEGADLLNIAGTLANERVFLTSFRLDSRFIKRYKSRFGKEPGIAASLGYDSLSVIAEAIHSKNSTDPFIIRDGLHSLAGYIGATGKISFDRNGDPIRQIVIRKITNGTFEEM